MSKDRERDEYGDGVDAPFRLAYDELRRLARAALARLPPGQTLQPTALVNEAYLRLVRPGDGEPPWNDREHFIGIAARAMRLTLYDHARRKLADKRGGKLRRVDAFVSLPDGDAWVEHSLVDYVALHDALERMSERYPVPARIVTLRYFGGLTMDEIARALDVSTRTVERDWRFARAWLRKALDRA